MANTISYSYSKECNLFSKLLVANRFAGAYSVNRNKSFIQSHLKYSSSEPHSDFLSILQKTIYLSSSLLFLLSYSTKSFLIFTSGTVRKEKPLPPQFLHLVLLNSHLLLSVLSHYIPRDNTN